MAMFWKRVTHPGERNNWSALCWKYSGPDSPGCEVLESLEAGSGLNSMLPSIPAFQPENASKQPEQEANFLKLFLEISVCSRRQVENMGCSAWRHGNSILYSGLCITTGFPCPLCSVTWSVCGTLPSLLASCSSLHWEGGDGLVTRGSLQLLESGKCKGGWTGMLEK